MRIFENTTFDFFKVKKISYIVSGVLFLASIGAIVGRGIQYGIDFKGGVEFVVEFDQPITVAQVRQELNTVLQTQPEVKLFGSNTEILIRTDAEMEINALQSTITEKLNEAFSDNKSRIIKRDVVTPRFADDLKWAALQAVLFAIVLIFLYILIRFKGWTFSAGAVAALVHDVVITLGIFTMLDGILPFEMSIDQTMIAALLTIVGYSLNDTVIIFDRVRENRLLHKTEELTSLVNRSINQTLSRTIITSGTTLFVVFVLFLFGGEVLKGLSFALILGIFFGTYSTIFVASALYVDLSAKKSRS